MSVSNRTPLPPISFGYMNRTNCGCPSPFIGKVNQSTLSRRGCYWRQHFEESHRPEISRVLNFSNIDLKLLAVYKRLNCFSPNTTISILLQNRTQHGYLDNLQSTHIYTQDFNKTHYSNYKQHKVVQKRRLECCYYYGLNYLRYGLEQYRAQPFVLSSHRRTSYGFFGCSMPVRLLMWRNGDCFEAL